MEENLISKKELLDRYGISYGALYRWKRMGLIPEEWFLRRATPTGQETFFHREQICPRVELILDRGGSLEDLAGELTKPAPGPPPKRLLITDGYRVHRFQLSDLTDIQIEQGGKVVSLIEYIREVNL